MLEIERKFAATPDTPLPPLSVARYGPSETFGMRAVYFDTPDFVLSRTGVAAVRQRAGGADQGWHVKLSLSPEHRQELHAPLEQAFLPGRLRESLSDVIGTQPLVPLVVVSTRRTETKLLAGDGTELGVLCRDVVHTDARGHEQSWAEWEVETVHGDEAWLDTVTEQFAAAGVERAEHSSKFVKAVGPLLALPEPRGAAAVVMRYAALQVGTIQAHADAVVADGPDAVHKTRVATRRLRSALRTFRPVFGDLNRLRRGLGGYATALGAARDTEVLREVIESLLDRVGDAADPATASRILSALDDDHSASHAGLVAEMRKRKYSALRVGLEDFVAIPPLVSDTLPTAVLGEMVAVAEHKTLAAAEIAVALDTPEAWHRVRKLAKAARYCNEAIAGDDAAIARRAERWEAVTEALGAAQDADIATQRLHALAADWSIDPAEDVTMRALIAQAASDHEDAVAQARHALNEVRRS
jgi:CHAD domain-containing protein